MVPKDYVGCWEMMKCGREPGGRNAQTHGVCTVARQPGSTCWMIAGHGGKNSQDLCLRLQGNRRTCYDCKVYLDAHEPIAIRGGGSGPTTGRIFGGWVDAIDC